MFFIVYIYSVLISGSLRITLTLFVKIPFDFDEVYKRRTKIKFEDTIIPVIPVKTLIEMKKKSGRPQDKADVFYLKKFSKRLEP